MSVVSYMLQGNEIRSFYVPLDSREQLVTNHTIIDYNQLVTNHTIID